MPCQNRSLEISGHGATFASLLVDKYVGKTAAAGSFFGSNIAHGETDDNARIADPLCRNFNFERIPGQTLTQKIHIGIDGKRQKIGTDYVGNIETQFIPIFPQYLVSEDEVVAKKSMAIGVGIGEAHFDRAAVGV